MTIQKWHQEAVVLLLFPAILFLPHLMGGNFAMDMLAKSGIAGGLDDPKSVISVSGALASPPRGVARFGKRFVAVEISIRLVKHYSSLDMRKQVLFIQGGGNGGYEAGSKGHQRPINSFITIRNKRGP
jgi:hypothetical protein